MGRGGGGGSWGARPPSPTAYFVALGGVVILLAMLCLYCLYFCLSRVKELSTQELVPQCPAKVTTTSYPVQPGVREEAQAMAKMCREMPIATRDADCASPSIHDSSVASHITNDASVSSQSHSTQDTSVGHVVNDARAASISQTGSATEATNCQAVSSEVIDDASVASPICSVNVASPIHANPASFSDDASRDSGFATRSSLRNSLLFYTDRAQDSLTSITSATIDSSSPLAVCTSHDANVASHSDDTPASLQLHDACLSSETNDAGMTSQASYDASASSQTLDDAALPYDLTASKLTTPAVITTVNELATRQFIN